MCKLVNKFYLLLNSTLCGVGEFRHILMTPYLSRLRISDVIRTIISTNLKNISRFYPNLTKLEQFISIYTYIMNYSVVTFCLGG